VARVLADITPLRRHRDFRKLWFGQMVSGIGSQLTIVGVAYETYKISHSTLMVGLVSLVQLGPLLIGSMGGGTVADAKDRRRVLLVTQVMLALTSAGLALNASFAHPSLWPIFLCTAASAGFQGFDWPARNAALPMLVPMADLPAALALQSILWQTSAVVGPALAGLLISQLGINVVFIIDVATFGVALLAVASLPALVPQGPRSQVGFRSIAEGFSHLRKDKLLLSTFWIDLDAMIFGMPRAVFPAIATGLYGGGAGTVGLLYAAPGIGAFAGSLLSGWIGRVRRQGRALVLAMVVWGGAIAIFGLVPILWVGLAMLAIAGSSDMVGTVFRNAMLQASVPDNLRGRLSGTFFAVASSGPRLGDAEAGGASAIGGAQFAVWSGGLACIAGLAVIVWRTPGLWQARVDDAAPEATIIQAISVTTTELSEAEPA
jgi:MFS family permease